MNYSWNLVALLVLLAMALWFGKGAVRSVGIYHYSCVVANGDVQRHVCDDPECPAVALFSAIEDTHRKVRTEAVVAVVESLLVTLIAVAYAVVLLMGRLV